ncbi:MAG: type II toxin-antitoxin system VapC family toxin [Pseudomonadota bacterium]|nr:type II toxin-antitoxin system VapC family toxin [Pseudomonadota bacterium]
MVVDASVAVKWAVSENGSEAAASLLSQPLVAPDLFLAEFGNALAKKVRRREIAREQAWQALEEGRGRVEIIPSAGLLAPAFELSLALHHSIYDCFYVALAEALDRPVITADVVLVAKVREAGMGARILRLGEAVDE